MTHRLLLAEQSATMRYVIEKHAESQGFAVDAFDTYGLASQSLERQFKQFGADYSGVIFGWPISPQDDAAAFAEQLESSDHRDLPVVVMSTDMRAEARAWIAERGNAALLGWKEYQGLEAQLRDLMDDIPEGGEIVGSEAGQTANNDIRLLVVDDSATIRYSMRDLFQSQGYTVALAATREAAMQVASSQAIDIAVLDYYLTDTTGDVLCRELLASDDTGDIVCTILTGTYSDHIIKRSLRAGAVECMFKNESSELLLSRINALSEFVRQKRQLQVEQQLLEDVLECIAGAVILISKEQRIIYVNTPAIEELGLSEKAALVGQSAQALLEADGPGPSGKIVHTALWTVPGGGKIEIDYQHSLIETSGYSLVRFAKHSAQMANAELVELQSSTDPLHLVHDAIRQLSLSADVEPFFLQMQNYLDNGGKYEAQDADSATKTDMHVSLLLLDVFVRPENGADAVPVSEDATVAAKVEQTLKAMVAVDNHMVVLSGSRYGFLLRHAEDSQAYVLTRKVMQRCLESQQHEVTDKVIALACSASLLSLTKNAAHSLVVLTKHALNGLELVNARELDHAILLDLRRLLSAYPEN